MKVKKLTTPHGGKDIEQIDLSNTVDGNVKWYNYFGKQPTSSLFFKFNAQRIL